MTDRTGNLPSLPGVFPDMEAPVVRNGYDGDRELTMMRWGMPSPKFVTKDRKTDPGVTNIRNTKSPHWRRWLSPEHRCVVAFTSFSEYERAGGKKVPVWIALSEERPLAVFASIMGVAPPRIRGLGAIRPNHLHCGLRTLRAR
ncbi:hypothetical protein FP2506_17534 [Fulvimarina pelagi HTCC2506]|uniref:Abasic site processing protein n=1 Tax=Fulvimarina pelagi HTCC2506 TaxID=314231 RepID=Q0FY41_9HYPH|nr:hypothetical protein FP2506_17534 [Fulvimarina pelagi HTCC2506]